MTRKDRNKQKGILDPEFCVWTFITLACSFLSSFPRLLCRIIHLHNRPSDRCETAWETSDKIERGLTSFAQEASNEIIIALNLLTVIHLPDQKLRICSVYLGM